MGWSMDQGDPVYLKQGLITTDAPGLISQKKFHFSVAIQIQLQLSCATGN